MPKQPTPPEADDHAPAIKPPSALLLMLEGRAPWEYAALVAASPWFSRLPRGDGHAVIVFPGLGASDITTAPLRRFLQARGYQPYPWKLGLNLGPREGVVEGCRSLVSTVAERHGSKVSLIGWSLGGVYAREMAKEMPLLTRCVITLGSPFSGPARATNAWRFFEWVSGQSADDPQLIGQLRRAPPVPTTSIFSRTDGVVAWQCSLNDAAPNTENIEIAASHIGMGVNPLALFAVADRLAQDPSNWRPFEVQGVRRWFYRVDSSAPAHLPRERLPSAAAAG
jgi:pimeloyl-ACP methyl ester carboxylesterase